MVGWRTTYRGAAALLIVSLELTIGCRSADDTSVSGICDQTVVAVAMTFVLLVAGIDLSVGSVMA